MSGGDPAQTPMAQEFLSALSAAQQQMGYNSLNYEELNTLRRLAKRAGFKLLDQEGFNIDPKHLDSPKEKPRASGLSGPSAGSGGMSDAAKRRAPSEAPASSEVSDGSGSESFEVIEDKVSSYFDVKSDAQLPKGVLSIEQWSATIVTMPKYAGQTFHELTVGSLGHHDEWKEEQRYLRWLHSTYAKKAAEQLKESGEFSSQAFDLANYLDAINWTKEIAGKCRYQRSFK